MRSPVAPFDPGTVIGDKYVLSRLLGEGGMGTVYAARNIELDNEVAIKVLHAEVSAIPDFVTRFKREARACAMLRNEHITRVYDVGTTDQDIPYMVMELLHGEDLESLLNRKTKLPAQEAVGYLLQACEGVAEAHHSRLIHRDLKPANLFLATMPGREPLIKVVDFGIVKQLGGSEVDALTKTASMIGTVLYMAPEQLRRKKDIDERVDIWALGVVLYELVTGSVPFVGDTMPEVVAKVLEHDFVPARTHVPDLPPGLSEVIDTALAADPANRYLTVTDFARALVPFAREADRANVHIARISSMVPGARTSGAPRSEIRALKPRRPSVTSLPILAAVGVLFIVAFTTSFFALRSRGHKLRADATGQPTATVPAFVPTIEPPAAVAIVPHPVEAPKAAPSAPVPTVHIGAGAGEGSNPLKKMRIK